MLKMNPYIKKIPLLIISTLFNIYFLPPSRAQNLICVRVIEQLILKKIQTKHGIGVKKKVKVKSQKFHTETRNQFRSSIYVPIAQTNFIYNHLTTNPTTKERDFQRLIYTLLPSFSSSFSHLLSSNLNTNMGLRSRTLEITVISGENVRIMEDAYVVVRAESLNCCTTRSAKDHGTNFLSWNEKFLLDVPMHARSITFEVQCTKFKAFRPLGVARIAASDFLGDAAVPENQLQEWSYGLRDWEGKRNGVIHFAVRLVPPPPPKEEKCLKPSVKAVVTRKGCGYGLKAGDKKKEVVNRVPFWWNYPNIV